MNTRFQISSQRGHCSSWSGMQCGPSLYSSPRSKWSSEQGPQGPTSAIRHQFFSSPAGKSPQRAMRSSGRPISSRQTPIREVVGRVDRRRQALARHAHVAGQELPGPVDRLALEVVAEAPVAEHLEEGVVARRAPDLLEVVVLAGDPQAALVVDGPGVAALLGPGQGVLERHHPRVDEEQRRIAGRNERGGRHDLVAALGEELHEPPADLGGRQRGDPRVMAKLGARHRRVW